MLCKSLRFALLLTLFFSHQIYARCSDNLAGIWTLLNITGNLNQSGKWKYSINTQLRIRSDDNIFQQSIFRPSIGYQYKPDVSFWLGYDWAPTLPRNTNLVENEQRVWQQISWKIVNNKQVFISSRTRLEQRKDEYEPQWAVRLREKIRISFPDKLFNRYTPVFYDEIFFNINHPVWVSRFAVDQNRIFVGIATAITKNVTLETGYLNQLLFRSPKNVMDHILYAGILVSI